MADIYVSWQYGSDSNAGTAGAPILTLAHLDSLLADTENVYFQKTEKPLIMDSAGNPAYLKFTNNSDTVYVQTSASIVAGSPATDSSFDDSIWDYSNNYALDFIASQYDDTDNLPGQPHSQSVWYGVKSVSSGVITLNSKWYSSNESVSTITDRAVWASGSYDVTSTSTSTTDPSGMQENQTDRVGLIGGYTYDGSSTWTAPAEDSDEESVFRNESNFNAYNQIDGTAMRMWNPYSSRLSRLTFFNFNYGIYMGYPKNTLFEKIKASMCRYGLYLFVAANNMFRHCIFVNMSYGGLWMNGNSNNIVKNCYFFGRGMTVSNYYDMAIKVYNSSHNRIEDCLVAGAYYNGIAAIGYNSHHNTIVRPNLVSPYNGGASSATNYGVINIDTTGWPGVDNTHNELLYPTGWYGNPGGSTHGLYAATIYMRGTVQAYSPRGINPLLYVVSGSEGQHQRTYYNNFDTNVGNDSEIGYIEKSGSGLLSQGESIAFYPKFGGVTDSTYPQTYNSGDQWDRWNISQYSGSDYRGGAIDLPFKFPVANGKKLKVTFYAKEDNASTFDGYFGQYFSGTFNHGMKGKEMTGSMSQSILTTDWKQYELTSPTMGENTVLECHFVCSGSQGHAALDQISSSYV